MNARSLLKLADPDRLVVRAVVRSLAAGGRGAVRSEGGTVGQPRSGQRPVDNRKPNRIRASRVGMSSCPSAARIALTREGRQRTAGGGRGGDRTRRHQRWEGRLHREARPVDGRAEEGG